jgi:carbon storage regulator CsrA
MLVLSRRNKEAVVIGGLERFKRMIKITVVQITSRRVRLAFEAAADVPVNGFEVWKRICVETR